MAKHRILVIDDEALMREYVEEAMIRAGHSVGTAANGADGVKQFESHGYDIVVTDLKMAPMDGLEVLRRIREIDPQAQVILMTAYGTIETAVTALKDGAADYILKPFTPDAIELAVKRAIDRARLAQENAYLRQQLAAQYDPKGLVGQSEPMKAVYDQVQKVADSRATVLIRGESGTGKELVAHAIHNSSSRRDSAFIKVNCAALSAGILESELFGHEKGAFTGAHSRKIGRFELADSGTLLLDEVSEINVELQAKLLRALQEREFERVGGTDTIQVDTRILATSNRPLEESVADGKFREDLFYRLNVITIQVPPLRQRRADIPMLMRHFLERSNRENGREVEGFTPEAEQLFVEYDWPGNVRELQNAIERAVVLSSEPQLEPRHFQLGAVRGPAQAASFTPGTTIAEMERQMIFETLEHCQQNRTRAAELLGISVRTMRNKLREYREEGE